MGRDAEKDTAEESKRLSIFWLRKKGLIGGYRKGTASWTWDNDSSSRSSISITTDTDELYIEFEYTQTSYYGEEKRNMKYRHRLVTTACNFGGVRYWFECNLSRNGRYCGRRVGVFYKSSGTWHWGCRHCHNIGYESQRFNHSNIFMSLMSDEFQIEKLEKSIKRWYWRGIPTRKYKRLLKYSS